MLVVTPESMVTMHSVLLDNTADAASSSICAVEVPELATEFTVKEVDPQPQAVGADNPLMVKYGRTIVIVSPICRSTFSENLNEIADIALVTGVASVSCVRTNAGGTTAVETSTGVAGKSKVFASCTFIDLICQFDG